MSTADQNADGWVPRELLPAPDLEDESISELHRCDVTCLDGKTRQGVSFMVEVPDGINATEIVLTNGQLKKLMEFGRYTTRPRKLAARNCANCRFLKWESGDVNDSAGWVCDGRVYRTPREEAAHLNRLESEAYREKAKVCHEHHDNLVGPSGCI